MKKKKKKVFELSFFLSFFAHNDVAAKPRLCDRMASSDPDPPSSEVVAGLAEAGAVDDVPSKTAPLAVAAAHAGAARSDRAAASKCAQEPGKEAAPAASTTTTAPLPAPHPPPRPLLPPSTYGTVFTNAKAGMESVDFDHVKKVVYEASANSLHGAHQARRDALLSVRVEALGERALRLKRLEPGTVAAAERAADALASNLLPARDRGRSWVCLDM